MSTRSTLFDGIDIARSLELHLYREWRYDGGPMELEVKLRGHAYRVRITPEIASKIDAALVDIKSRALEGL